MLTGRNRQNIRGNFFSYRNVVFGTCAIFISVFCFFGSNTAKADVLMSFSRNLGLGNRGADVLSLQRFLNTDSSTRVSLSGPGSPGLETETFGSLTRDAVNRFQKKYAGEILAVGQAPTGFVGPKTLKKLNALIEAKNAVVNQVKAKSSNSSSPLPSSAVVPPSPSVVALTPAITSVYPDRVRRGDVVTITGNNFTPKGNTVTLIDGPVYASFDNLSSSDGKTISFVFEPPVIKTMSESEIRALPSNLLEQIEKPIKAANKTLSEVLGAYNNIRSESELRSVLQQNGHSFDEIYNYYFVTVKNSGGEAVSQAPLLHGLRSLPIPGLADNKADNILLSFGKKVGKFISSFFPTAYAQALDSGSADTGSTDPLSPDYNPTSDAIGNYGGGINTGIVMICTCGDGYLTFMTDYSGGGSGLYWFSWGFMANVGAGYITPNWLGGYQTMTATCSIYAGVECFDINANQAVKPWGTNLF